MRKPPPRPMLCMLTIPLQNIAASVASTAEPFCWRIFLKENSNQYLIIQPSPKPLLAYAFNLFLVMSIFCFTTCQDKKRRAFLNFEFLKFDISIFVVPKKEIKMFLGFECLKLGISIFAEPKKY